jgi:hypothetical protein
MRILMVMVLASAVCAFAGDSDLAPLPDKITDAKTVFLMNDTGKAGLGDGLYKQIKTWNRWQVVTDKEKADLVLSLTDKSGVSNFNGSWYLVVTDPHTKEELWRSRTTMQGKLWRSWGAVAESLNKDLRKRM